MALEDAVVRLAAAVERSQTNAAVAELIRERDSWQAEADKHKRRAEMYQQWYQERGVENRRLGRVIAALRGVITRMKRKEA